MASKSSKRRRKKRRQAHQSPQDRPATAQAAEEEGPEAPAATRPAAASRPRRGERNPDDERPPAPWGSFPVVEIAVLVGIVMLILGFLVVKGDRAPVLVVTGLALCSIGGLEVAIREHFAGFRSHTMILAGVPAAIVLALLFYAGPAGLSSIARAGIAAAVYAAGAYLLVRLFRERSGGRSFRFSGFGGGR